MEGFVEAAVRGRRESGQVLFLVSLFWGFSCPFPGSPPPREQGSLLHKVFNLKRAHNSKLTEMATNLMDTNQPVTKEQRKILANFIKTLTSVLSTEEQSFTTSDSKLQIALEAAIAGEGALLRNKYKARLRLRRSRLS